MLLEVAHNLRRHNVVISLSCNALRHTNNTPSSRLGISADRMGRGGVVLMALIVADPVQRDEKNGLYKLLVTTQMSTDVPHDMTEMCQNIGAADH